MSEYKEFQEKSLDAAIAEACAYYDSPREKLEIEIVQDAKSGIFGLVGARKAIVRARRAQLPELDAKQPKGKGGRKAKAEATAPETAPEAVQEKVSAPEKPADKEAPKAAPEKSAEKAEKPAQAEKQQEKAPKGRGKNSRQPAAPQEKRQRPQKDEAGFSESDAGQADGDAQELSLPRLPLADMDQDKLIATSRDVIRKLIEPIVDDMPVEVSVGEDRVMISINGDDTGLLIGREGQNLAAVQYLAARIISRLMNAQVRIQVDAGDYHSRQDNRLKDLARNLAEKVRNTGKSMSTKPLSAYQRRVIHLCLQDDPEVYTRSSGDGAMKRVVVMRRKEGQQQG